ncbi:MAG: hypothetical protein KKE62_04260 [Proteobacteria bacterium]|nr:hypothetical protein [Pseudomonadota bacterium]MBU1387974.1 hypothetical protein [Pseudomonadota bacterium]MBU1542037.1 hypothetical protein [Pseudomonadota bacterium]MBU2431918.1 hypothetical protein [Pseudomonadota bacterium]MBU2483056.1 hypothetical protein [Pseudomonadota bacterium]
MKKILISCSIFLFILFSLTPAQAHSTQDRVKIPLDKDVLEIDDIAYFIESHVHRQFYNDRYEQAEKRFYVESFTRIEQLGDRADIYFKTLDVKTNDTFDDKISILRMENGKWAMKTKGRTTEIYTYVTKSSYYYKTYIFPLAAVGVVLAGLEMIFLRLKNRRGKLRK